MRGDLLDRLLPVLGGVADVVGRRTYQQRELLPQPGDGLQGLVDAERGLRQPDEGLVGGEFEVVDVVGSLDEGGALWRLPHGALHLLVTGVPDQEDVGVLGGEPLGLAMHLRHERAGGVDGPQLTARRLLTDRRRDPMRGEHHQGVGGHLVQLVDEDRAALLQGGDDVLVVHDLLAHIHGRAVGLKGLLHGGDSAVHARAVAAWRSDDDPLGGAHAGQCTS